MAKVKFIAAKGSSRLAREPFYRPLVQHERTLPKREAYEYCAAYTGYQATQVRAVFLALRDTISAIQANGNITFINGVASIRNFVKGAFDALNGPWVKGVNYLNVQAVEMDPFKSALAGVVPENNTEGANPAIKSVFDETTMVYDTITGTDVFSVAGSGLAVDTTKDDEYVAFVGEDGVETKAVVDFSDLQTVRAHLASAIAAGEYTLKVYTRSGLGDEYGVHVASRKVTIA